MVVDALANGHGLASLQAWALPREDDSKMPKAGKDSLFFPENYCYKLLMLYVKI